MGAFPFGGGGGVPSDVGSPVPLTAASGEPILESVLSSETVSVGAVAAQICTAVAVKRNLVAIRNTHATQTLYVAPWSGVTTTHYYAKLAPGELLEEYWGPAVEVWVLGSGAATTGSAFQGVKRPRKS